MKNRKTTKKDINKQHDRDISKKRKKQNRTKTTTHHTQGITTNTKKHRTSCSSNSCSCMHRNSTSHAYKKFFIRRTTQSLCTLTHPYRRTMNRIPNMETPKKQVTHHTNHCDPRPDCYRHYCFQTICP